MSVAPLERLATKFDSLYATYQPLLRAVAVHKFGVRSGDVDDLVQDVFATYLANHARVRDVRAYLVGAICNASRQYHRRDQAIAIVGPDCSHTPDVDAIVRTIAVSRAIARLGSRCRETLEQFYLRGETTAAIAKRRATTANYICRLLNYCRNRARALMLRDS